MKIGVDPSRVLAAGIDERECEGGWVHEWHRRTYFQHCFLSRREREGRSKTSSGFAAAHECDGECLAELSRKILSSHLFSLG